MSESISSDGVSGSQREPGRKPSPQPFSQSIPEPRSAGGAPRTSSIYDESEPVVRNDPSARQQAASNLAVTGNAPERRPAENPFPKAAPGTEPARVSPSSSAPPQLNPLRRAAAAATSAAAQASSTLKAAEQLRAAAAEKARQLREAQAVPPQQAPSEATAETTQAEVLAQIPQALSSPPAAAAVESQAPAPQVQDQVPPSPAGSPPPAALSPSAQLKVDEWKEIAEATWADASIVLKDVQKEGERYIRANPTRAALTALGVGFVLGVFLKR